MSSNTKLSHKADLANCNYTTWSPDTCGCTITYEWDKSTTETPETREHRPLHPDVELRAHDGQLVQHHKKCEHHKHITDAKEHFDIVLEENQRKNKEHGKIGIDKQITWEFTGTAPNRTLHVFHEGKKVSEVEKIE